MPLATAPPGAENLFFTPGSLSLVGDTPASLPAQDALLRNAAGRRISVAALFELAATLERGFAMAGFPLARVVVPVQTLEDGGAIRLTAVAGYIESIDVSALPVPLHGALQRRLAPMVGVRHLTQAELERRLLLAGELPGLRLRSTLAAGRGDGATRLVLDGTFHHSTLSVAVDNRLDRTLGHWQWGASGALNGTLGAQEQLYALARVSPGSRLRILGLGATLALGEDGLVAGAEWTASTTRAESQPGVVDARGQLRRSALRLSKAVWRGREATVTAGASIEQVEQWSEAPAFGIDLKRDRYRAARLVLDGGFGLGSGGWLTGHLSATQGQGGRDEADAAASAVPLSRQGASPRLRRVSGSLSWSQSLGAPLSRIELSAAGQGTGGRAVFQSEQFALDAPNLVSGHVPGSGAVDAGLAMRVEVVGQAAAMLQDSGLRLAPYLFAAAGRGSIALPTAAEPGRISLRSQGVGLRVDGAGPLAAGSTTLGIEWARPQGSRPAADNRGRWSASLAMSL